MRRCLLVASAAFLLFVQPSLGQEKKSEDQERNLIENGSFEDGPEVDAFLSLDVDSRLIKGWTVTRGQIDYIGAHWKSAEGKRSIDLHGSPGYGGIKQTFKTEKGKRYRLTFAMAGTPKNAEVGGGVKLLCVRAAGKKEAFSFDTTDKTRDELGWATKTWEFVAVEEETTLEFHTLENEDPYGGPALDHVRVIAVRDRK